MIADQVGLPKSIVHEIVTTELQMRKVCAILVPKVLTDEQKENRVIVIVIYFAFHYIFTDVESVIKYSIIIKYNNNNNNTNNT